MSLHTNELAYKDIYEQYIDEASFLWLMHSIAVDQPHYNITDLKKLEQRINSQLDGLMTAIDLSWEICEKSLELEGGGEVFTATMVAFRSHDQLKIQKAVEAGFVSDECFKGLSSAISWLPDSLAHPWIKNFFTSKDINHKYLALEVCSLRSDDPANFLVTLFQREDCLNHEKLYMTLLRITGELKRHDLIEYVETALSHDNDAIKFWAIRSAILLGKRDYVLKLEPYVFKAGDCQLEAIQIAFRALPLDESRKWVSRFVNEPNQLRNVIIATGVLGDPHAVDWLLLKMRELSYARIAAESFCMITGADIEKMLMALDAPEHVDDGSNEDPEDANVKMHDDENLPWPNVELVSSYWNGIRGKYIVGKRYLLGGSIDLATLTPRLNTAYQRQRHALAYEIAMLDKSEKLVNTRSKVS